MPRVKGGPRASSKHKKVIKQAKGYRGTRSKLFSRANQAVLKAGEEAFHGRRERKRQFRQLWIVRISSALENYDINYSRFINGLTKAKIDLNRKVLSEMAINDPDGFEEVVKKAKAKI